MTEEEELRAEIAWIRAQLDKSIKTQEQLDRSRSKASSIVKNWLRQTGYWNSFLLGIPGIILFEIGTFIMPYPLGLIGGLMIVGAILFTPFLRPVWDNNYRPPGNRVKP